MRLLLDTNVILRLALEPERLSRSLIDRLESDATRLVVSVVAAWEISIKWQIGRLPIPRPPEVWVPTVLREFGAELMTIELDHVLRVAELPAHHGDPFDRLLIAQGQVESLPIVTADRSFSAYDVEVIPAK
ncbi:type II toxin-antitoxin system VapC family toxin [Pseudonocardia sp. CA-107938]|uniref:type II toxin-antitoxin system VapC family toxin n=1 Tax=Pseudonocardia sp. CA-107938 TaxID=3240021 RepID=UPI003D8EF86B